MDLPDKYIIVDLQIKVMIEKDHVIVDKSMREFIKLNADKILDWLSAPVHYEANEPCSNKEVLEGICHLVSAVYAKEAFVQLVSENREKMTAGALWLILSYMTPAQFQQYGIPEFAKGIVTEDMLLVKNNMYTLVIPRYISDISMFNFVEEHRIEEIVILSDIKKIEGAYCFSELKTLKKVVLPEGLEEIGNHVFYECENLETVVIPDSVKMIDDYAFCMCRKLKLDKLPSSIEFIGVSAFLEGVSISDLIFPSNTIIIGQLAFSECEQMKKVEISSRIIGGIYELERSGIDMERFKNEWDSAGTIFENSFIESLSLSNIEYIDAFFQGSSTLKDVSIGTGAKVIGNAAFADMSVLEEIILPDGVVEIEEYAFANCEKLKKVVLPDSLIKIADDAFESSTNVQIEYKDKVYSYSDLDELYLHINSNNN